jgi:hypothetical protein
MQPIIRGHRSDAMDKGGKSFGTIMMGGDRMRRNRKWEDTGLGAVDNGGHRFGWGG